MYNPNDFWSKQSAWFLQNLAQWNARETGLKQEMGFLYKEIVEIGVNSVLEVGCGTGTNLEMLAQLKPRLDLTGLDISQEILRESRKSPILMQAGTKIVRGEAWSLPFRDKQFDLVFTRVCLMHVPPNLIKNAVSELVRVSENCIIIETVGRFKVNFCFDHPYRKIIKDLDLKWELIDRRAVDDDFERVILRIV